MSDIGPGDWVEKLHDGRIPPGTVAEVVSIAPRFLRCRFCRLVSQGLILRGFTAQAESNGGGWCPAHWRKRDRPWSEWLTSEPADHREPVS